MMTARHAEKAKEMVFHWSSRDYSPAISYDAGEIELSLTAALAEAERAGFERGIEDAVRHLADYRRAYAEDLFIPIRKQGEEPLPENQHQMDIYTTRVSAHMGRFILDNACRDIRALKEKQ